MKRNSLVIFIGSCIIITIFFVIIYTRPMKNEKFYKLYNQKLNSSDSLFNFIKIINNKDYEEVDYTLKYHLNLDTVYVYGGNSKIHNYVYLNYNYVKKILHDYDVYFLYQNHTEEGITLNFRSSNSLGYISGEERLYIVNQSSYNFYSVSEN